jgi:HSP20 family molecular chaperone IbpA
VSGKKEREIKDITLNHKIHEITSGKFERNFRVPKDLDASTICAKFTNGVLTIEYQKPKAVVRNETISVAVI